MEAYKVIMVGDTGVGKTSIVNKFVLGDMDPSVAPTVGSAVNSIRVKLDDTDEIVSIDLWDTAGQEKYQCLIPMYTRNAKGIIIVADLTIPFQNCQEIYDRIYTGLIDQGHADIPMILAANKSDLDYSNENQSAICGWAAGHNIEMVTTSAFTGNGVTDLFMIIARLVNKTKLEDSQTVDPTAQTEKKKKCC